MPPRSLRSLPPEGARPALGRPGVRPTAHDNGTASLGRSLRWPLGALAAWLGAWVLFAVLRGQNAPVAVAFAFAAALGAAASLVVPTTWRRAFVGAGFPLSFVAAGFAGGLPGWAWLAPLIALAVVYPVGTWRDAPMFPTRRGTLQGLAATLPLADGARVLDAGCGLGHALHELRREYPNARFDGIEWSWPLRFACALRCRFARIVRADMWAADWSGHELVYVFQRPESMARVIEKAERELAPGAWLASLEFAVASRRATRTFHAADGRPVWLYRMPG